MNYGPESWNPSKPQTEDTGLADVLSNSKPFRRIRHVLHDAGFDAAIHAEFLKEQLDKRIIRAISDKNTVEHGLKMCEAARRLITASTGIPMSALLCALSGILPH